MSDDSPVRTHDDPDDRDLLAGEYVLGVLDAAGARDVEARAVADAALAGAIADWHLRLAPLAEAIIPIAPPADLWRRIAAATILTPIADRQLPVARATDPRMRRQLAFWRSVSAGALALAAVFAGIVYLGKQPTERGVAVLAAAGAPAPMFLAEAEGGAIRVRPLVETTVAADKDMELWVLPVGATRPVSLGVLPPGGRRIALADLPADKTQLMVSLEPRGGSPTGLPTGPVLYAGVWTRL